MNNIPTPETDAEVNEMRKSITYNMVTAAYARDLEQRLILARTALQNILNHAEEMSEIEDLAWQGLDQTAPKP